MSVEDERSYISSNKYGTCNKLFAVGDNKPKDHYHVAGK